MGLARQASSIAGPPHLITSPSLTDAHPRAGDLLTARPSHRRAPARIAERLPARDLWMAAALGTGALVLYVRTLLPGVGYSGDTAKWQFIGKVGGTPHATGYPLFLALDKAWVNAFPFGTLAWRVNLLSAVFGAATVATLALLLRVLGVRRVVAAATAATFGVTITFWSQAVVAEVYTLHLLLLTSITLCLARWRFGGSAWWLRAGVALLALSFGNHLGTALAVPGVLWLVLSDWRRAVTPANTLWAVLMAGAGAAQYGYLLWMDDVGRYAEYRIATWADVRDVATGGPFRDAMFTFGPGELVDQRLPMLARLGWREVSLLALPAAFGAWRAVRDGGPRRHVAIHLLLLAVATTAYALEFGVEDVFVFFLPLWLAIVVFLGLGAETVATALGPRLRGVVGVIAAAAVLAVPVTMAVVNFPEADRSDDTAHARRIERLLDAAGRDALLVTDNYRDSEFIWYHLLGLDLGDRRNLRLGNQLEPEEVFEYLALRRPLPGIADAGLPVYTATTAQARDLRELGLDVTEVADGVWRVDLPDG
jgi:Protein of unknown function (DUF2723)